MTYFTFQNLLAAYEACCKRKTNTAAHLEFSFRLEDNLFDLCQELTQRRYRPEASIAFVVKHPKVREVFAANFRDRVVHHLLIGYIEPKFERIFIHDSYACRKGKGTHKAVERLQTFLYKIRRHQPLEEQFYIKMDIRSFFTNIDRSILYDLIAKKIKKQEILWLTKLIVFHDCANDPPPIIQSSRNLFRQLPAGKSLFKAPPGKGLPIGNLTSQVFANIYLNELDQYIKRVLRVKYYIRYVDDFVIAGASPEQLRQYQAKIEQFLAERLQLELHDGKTILRPISNGVDFLGYIVRPDYKLVRRRVLGNWRKKLQSYQSLKEYKDRWSSNRSYFGHLKHANSRRLQKKMLDEISLVLNKLLKKQSKNQSQKTTRQL